MLVKTNQYKYVKGNDRMNEMEHKKLSIKEFDAAAKQFDGDDPSIYNMCRKDYPDILKELEKEPFHDMLDAGCGTGAVIKLLKSKYPDRNYTGIDLSGKMIAVAKQKNLDNSTFIHGDCENLPFAKESFDVITCSMSFHHYPNADRFFQSCNRVLRPNKGDVHVYNKNEIMKLCESADLKLEVFERRAGMRLHAVCRKV